MSPYEIVYAGGSVEHWNEEPGAVWMQRLLNTYPKAVWLNPEPDSAGTIRRQQKSFATLMDDRMYPLTLAGLDDGIKALHITIRRCRRPDCGVSQSPAPLPNAWRASPIIVLRDIAVRIDQKCLSLGDGHAKHLCFDAIGFGRLAVSVRQQRERQFMVLSELSDAIRRCQS